MDCKIWLQLLTDEAQHVMNRPMMDIFSVPEDLEDIGFFSDASASEKDGGFGAILQNQWLQGSWDTQFLIDCKPSIAYLELFALCAGILAWQNREELGNKRVRIHCDNQAVVQMINELTSSCSNCMTLIRLLVLNNMKWNRKVSAVYINTKKNAISDALSRNQMSRFWKLAPHMSTERTTIPSEIWPVNKIWNIMTTNN